MKKKTTAVLMAFLMAVSVAGCGSTGSSGAEETEKTEESTESTASEAQSFPADEANTSSEEMTADNVDEFIKLGEYKGLKIDAPADTVIENGMTANIDFAGSIDGEYFEGGTSEGYDLAIGSGSFIDTFEEQLIGHKAGDHVDVNVTFPEDYGQTELAGKAALFEVTINSVSYQSADSAFAELVSSSEVIKYPQDMVDSWKQTYIDQYGAYITEDSDDDAEAVDSDDDNIEDDTDTADDADTSDNDETADDADASDNDDTADDADASDNDDTADNADAAADADNAKTEKSPDEMLKDIAALFGMSEESLNEMILSNVKYCMVSRAVLAKEGITRDSESYQNSAGDLLKTYGFSSVEEAVAAGIPETQLYYSLDSSAAIQVIKDNQA